MTKTTDIAALAAQARDWAVRDALPFWATTGFDPARGAFRERLDLGGRPLAGVAHRLMVQCRQIAVYSLAATLGWYDARDRIAEATDSMIRSYYKADGSPGWIFAVDAEGRPSDLRREAYAHAFVLFGLGWAYRALGRGDLVDLADETLAFIDDELKAKTSGGLLDQIPRTDDLRRQNPHMHFFEAMLCLHEATGKAAYLARAGEIFGLVSSRFIDPTTGVLLEYFDDRWNPLPSRLLCEPGHHYEWIWLMRHFERLADRNVDHYVEPLYRHADAFGFDDAGLVVDELDSSGRVTKASRRSWPHTEGIKANAVEHEHGRSGAAERAGQMLARLSSSFLGKPVPGGWIDHIDAEGKPLVGFMPASTLYHVFFAVTEASRVFAPRAETAPRRALAAAQEQCGKH